MPQLTPEQQKQIEEAGGGGAVAPGQYLCSLQAVTTGDGDKGPFWSWEWLVVAPEGAAGRKLWNNTSLSEKSRWKFREGFDALGYPLDAHTDDMLGQWAVLVVSQRTIQSGQRTGQIGNQVDQIVPYIESEWDVPTIGEGDEGGWDDLNQS